MSKAPIASALEEALGIEPDHAVIRGKIIEEEQGHLEEDFLLARESLRKLVSIGTDCAEELGKLANSADNPNAHTALSALIKSTTDTAEKLVSLSKKYKESQQAISSPSEGDSLARLEKTKGVIIGTMAEAIEAYENSRTHESAGT